MAASSRVGRRRRGGAPRAGGGAAYPSRNGATGRVRAGDPVVPR